MRTCQWGEADEGLQWHCWVECRSPCRKGWGGDRKEESGGTSANQTCIYGIERKDRQDMDLFYPTGRDIAPDTGRSRDISCTCVPAGGEMLSTSASFWYSDERTALGSVFPVELWPRIILSGGCGTFLSFPAFRNACREQLSGKNDCREVSVKSCRTGVWYGRCVGCAVWGGFEEDIWGNGRWLEAGWWFAAAGGEVGGELFSFRYSGGRSGTSDHSPLLQAATVAAGQRNDRQCV